MDNNKIAGDDLKRNAFFPAPPENMLEDNLKEAQTPNGKNEDGR